MKAVADVSSLLSLEFMGILDETLGIADIYIPGPVEMELKEISDFNDERSRIAKRILEFIGDGRIRSVDVKRESYKKHIPGNACLALCISGKIPVLITDDAYTAYYLRRMALQKKIKVRICAAILTELIRTSRISRNEARKKLGELMKKRSWESGVLEVLAKKYMGENSMW